jgi:hypothetical protein
MIDEDEKATVNHGASVGRCPDIVTQEAAILEQTCFHLHWDSQRIGRFLISQMDLRKFSLLIPGRRHFTHAEMGWPTNRTSR